MKKVFGLLCPLVFSFALQATEILPYGVLQIGESVTNFTMYGVEGNEKLSRLNVDVAGPTWSVTGNAVVNPDPFIDYGFAIKNTGTTDLNFYLFLSTPYVGGPYTIGKSSHSGSVTDSSGLLPANGAVTVTPGAGGIHQPMVDATPFGAITGGCAVSGAPGDSFPCGLGNVNGIALSTGATGLLSVTLQGTLSAGDVYTFNGLASISNIPGDEVPEPATAGLAAAAFGMAFVIRKYRKA